MVNLVLVSVVLGISLAIDFAPAARAATMDNRHGENEERASAGADPAEGTPDPVGRKLQAFLVDAKKRLGPLEPWQNRIFDDEVLTEYQRFIRDYRASRAGVEAQADLDAIRNYLVFYAPKSLKKENPTLVVAYLPAKSCPKCVASAPAIRRLLQERLSHRGLSLIWEGSREFSARGDPRQAIDGLVAERKAVGSLLVEAGPAPVDSIDAAHEEDSLFRLRSTLVIGDVAQERQQLDLLDTGDFVRSESKLLTDAFTDLGDKVQRMEAGQSVVSHAEIQVEVSGFKDYSQYSKARDQITQSLQGLATVEERRVSRGQVVLAVETDSGLDKVRSSLGALDPSVADGRTLRINLAR